MKINSDLDLLLKLILYNGMSEGPDLEDLYKMANTKMPFGKYKGVFLIDLPEPYVVWFYGQGFPSGELGRLLQQIYEIKVNGLEYLIKPLQER